MKIGLGLAHAGAHATTTAVPAMARAAEAAGFASLWGFDRLLAPVHPKRPYPASADGALPPEQHRVLDPMIALTVAAAVTERIELGTNVLIAPLYPPVLLARSAASLDVLSGGRFTLGLGLGWSPDEYAAAGVEQRGLGMRMEEILEVLAVAWRDDVVEIDTWREQIAPSTIGLKPLRRRVPIVLAAYTPAGLERIARRADGWTPVGIPAEVAAAMWAGVLAQAERYGRDTSGMRLVLRGNVHLTDADLPEGRPEFVGSIAQVREDVERAREAGADELILELTGCTSTTDELIDVALTLTAGVAAVGA